MANIKLTDEQVKEILESNEASRILAPKYGVTDRYIRYIKSRTKRLIKKEVKPCEQSQLSAVAGVGDEQTPKNV